MKYKLLFIAFMVPQIAYSVPPLDLYGVNEEGELITVIGESGSVFHSEISIEKNNNIVNLKNQACTFFDNKFKCAEASHNPIGGVTYEFRPWAWDSKTKTYNCGRVLNCLNGCNSRAPIELMESGYECYDEAVCQNANDSNEAIVNTNKVNIRLNPHINSKVLGIVFKGDKIRLSHSKYRHSSNCTFINGKNGRWVHVIIENSHPIKDGYIFDHYVTYK